MAETEASILEEILRSQPTLLRKDGLLAFFREKAKTTSGDDLRAIWDDLFAFKEYLSRVADPYTLETLPYWQYSMAIEWIDSHFLAGDTFSPNLRNAKRFLGNIGGYYDFLIARGELSCRSELDRAVRELCGGKRLKLVEKIPYTGDELFTEIIKGKKKARFAMADFWLLLLLAEDFNDDWGELRIYADAYNPGRGQRVDDLKGRLRSIDSSGLRDIYFGDVSDHEIEQAREWFEGEAAEKPAELLPVAELKRRHALLKRYNEGDPWQKDGERVFRPMQDELRKYSEALSPLPEHFVPMAMDQYLAARWHSDEEDTAREKHRRSRAGDEEYQRAYELFNEEPWIYMAFFVLEDLGKGRYLCMDDEASSFRLYSPAMSNAIKEGSLVFFSLVLSIGDGWYMTHGPIQGWRGITLSDIVSFALRINRRIYDDYGVDGVVLSNPVPFWALWKYGNIPPISNDSELVVHCVIRGKLSPEFGENLPRTWKREDAGKKTRWVYGAGKDILRRRYVYLNRSTGRAFLAASCPGDFEKLFKFASPYFEPADGPPVVVSAVMTMIQNELLGVADPLEELEKPFIKKDK